MMSYVLTLYIKLIINIFYLKFYLLGWNFKYINIFIKIQIYIYIYTNLSVDELVRLPHPRSEDSQGQGAFLAPSADKQTHNYDTECSNHNPSLSTLRPKRLSRSKMKLWAIYKFIYIYIYIYIYYICYILYILIYIYILSFKNLWKKGREGWVQIFPIKRKGLL